ncbi:unnamed protein product [Candida verbasci]|uniref:Mediator of RNA polymerase II transcription subunit 22 n=1 Tax=Candida verbasci TaxID=1227364 RepID=A0A9W4TW59_9ASCO|nr:unnamed protein product [Candida verbasci]
MQPRSITLLQKIDQIVEQILIKFNDILQTFINEEKPKELLSIESISIENNAIQIIRLCQDLLNISRQLKEIWVLNSIKINDDEKLKMTDDEVKDIFKKFNLLTDKIAQFEDGNKLSQDE